MIQSAKKLRGHCSQVKYTLALSMFVENTRLLALYLLSSPSLPCLSYICPSKPPPNSPETRYLAKLMECPREKKKLDT